LRTVRRTSASGSTGKKIEGTGSGIPTGSDLREEVNRGDEDIVVGARQYPRG
jgi:hypothetical protein